MMSKAGAGSTDSCRRPKRNSMMPPSQTPAGELLPVRAHFRNSSSQGFSVMAATMQTLKKERSAS